MMLWYSAGEERLKMAPVRTGSIAIRFLLVACLLVPLVGNAAGLGRLTISSALGEPLRAEVEITSLQPGDEDALTARLGSPDAFRQAGIEYSPTLLSIRVALERRDGKPIVRLTSVRPINDPFVDLLLELQWATGRLVREYTFLLDPPKYERPPAAATPVPAPAPAPVARPLPTQPPTSVDARPLVREPVGGGRTYEVRKGDTLGKIARENRPEGVTFQQMLVALYRANQDAFIRNNMNLVRAGRILQIPDQASAGSVASAEATRVVRTHTADFAEYRAKLGAAVATRPATSPPGQREVTGRIAAKPEAPAPGAPKDQLKLSKADAAKPAAPSAQAAREDDKVAANRALKDAQSRVTDLEKNVTDLQRLVEMKNKQLAQLEQLAKPAAAAPKPAAETPKPAAEAPKPVPEAPKPMAEAPKPAAETPKPAAEAPKPALDAPKPAPAAPKPAPEAAKAQVPPKAKPKPAPVLEAGLLDEFLDNPLALGGLAGVVVLLAGYGVWAWRRKKATQSRFQDSVLGPGASAPPPVGSAAETAATAAAVSAALAATQPGRVAVEGDDVDPIAEADVYLAYGRDAQAEEILKDALGKHPESVAVHAKMLEIFAHRNDRKSFEQTAQTIKGLTQGTGPEWDKVRALGRSIDPDNDLYGGRGAAPTIPPPDSQTGAGVAPALDFDLGGGAPGAGDASTAAGRAAAVDFDIGAATTPGGKDQPFSPGGTIIIDPDRPPSKVLKSEANLDFDIGALEPPAPASATAPSDHSGSLDFDLDLDLDAPKPAPPAARASAPVDISTLSLDLGKPDSATAAASSDPKWQEVATKLDLAKAYQQMGDKDGARELLNEVINQGDSAQQNEAKQMLAALG